MPESTRKVVEKLKSEEAGGISLIPHFTLMETLAALPPLMGNHYSMATIYRPFDNENLDRWLRRSRERFGGRMLSRKKGFSETQRLIREGCWIGVLFDQNAGEQGVLTHFFGRVASATELPALLCRKFDVCAVITYCERIAFWRGQLRMRVLDYPDTREGVTLAANQWLENHLQSSDDACADWLWLHDRWKTQDNPRRRLRLVHKKSYLEPYLCFAGQEKHPRRTRIWVRMPNWLGDVVMALPLLRAIRAGRPEAEITLLVREGFLPFLRLLPFIDKVISLPEKSFSWAYFGFFRNLKQQYPDTILLLTNSMRGDLEARLTGCPQRFGMLRPGKWRPLLSHSWKLPADLDETKVHQARVWERYLRNFGLAEPLNLEPVFENQKPGPGPDVTKIGLICGTENQPGKRWPVTRWRDLIEQLLSHNKDLRFVLLGTKKDRTITDAVAKGLPEQRVENLAGETNLAAFVENLRECRLLVGNDTGGIHLANALGVPVAVVYGPTNPLRTGPVFEAPVDILQPAGCPPEGGRPIEEVGVERVAEAVLKLFKAGNGQNSMNPTP